MNLFMALGLAVLMSSPLAQAAESSGHFMSVECFDAVGPGQYGEPNLLVFIERQTSGGSERPNQFTALVYERSLGRYEELGRFDNILAVLNPENPENYLSFSNDDYAETFSVQLRDTHSLPMGHLRAILPGYRTLEAEIECSILN